MIKKITVGMLSLMVALLFTNLSFALEPGQMSYTAQKTEINELPPAVTQPISKYYHSEANTFSLDPNEASAVMQQVLARLEEARVDTRQLTTDMPLSIYALPGSFGLYGAFTVWFATGDSHNSILLGGIQENEAEAGTYKQTIAHEMGHAVSNRYFTQEIKAAYRKLRGIPEKWMTSTVWGQQPDEIFAEDFAYLFGSPEVYQNRSSKQTLRPSEAIELKALIVAALPSLNPQVTPSVNEADAVIALREKGIIQPDSSTLPEWTTYAAAPITNCEWIQWLYAWCMGNASSISDLEGRHRIYVYSKLYQSYAAQESTQATLTAIWKTFIPFAREQNIATPPRIVGDGLSHGEAALWILNASH